MPSGKPCPIDGCKRVVSDSHRLCSGHQKRKLAGLPMAPLPERNFNRGLNCILAGCLGKRHARKLCKGHYDRWLKATHSGTVERGEWKAKVRQRRSGRIKKSVSIWPHMIAVIQKRADERALSFGDALLELAAPEIAKASGPAGKWVWESLKPSGWERNDYDATERA